MGFIDQDDQLLIKLDSDFFVESCFKFEFKFPIDSDSIRVINTHTLIALDKMTILVITEGI